MMPVLSGLVLLGVATAAEAELDVGGAVQSDIRVRTAPVSTGSWYQPLELPEGFVRNENLFKLRASATGGRARLATDLDFVLEGFPQASELSDLSVRNAVDPFRVDVHSLYIESWEAFGIPGLDLRIGQQLVQWGAGDQFNPTNNLNADDLEDPLRFGDQMGNMMARADWSPHWAWRVTGVVVPIFKPALLPKSGALGLAAVDRLPMREKELRWRLFAEQAAAAGAMDALMGTWPTVVSGTSVQLPDPTVENMQWAVQLAGTIGIHDVALNYYKGRFDFPVAVANHTVQTAGEQCNPDDAEDCIDGLLGTEVTMAYPKMEVWGLNMAGEVNPLGWLGSAFQPIGYRAEVAWIYPETTTITLTQDELDFGFITEEAGEYDYGLGGARPVVLSDDPFFKWALGLDYSFGRHVYANVQWVHGMPDEMGVGNAVRAGGVDSESAATLGCALEQDGEQCATETLRSRVGDYIVLGTDLKFGGTLLRLFGIVDVTSLKVTRWDADQEKRVGTTFTWSDPEARSLVIYPEIQHNFGTGLELAAGALKLIGEPATKFGDPAGGGDLVFVRGRYSF